MGIEFRRFLTFMTITLVIVVAIDLVIGVVFDSLYDRMQGGERARAHYVIRKSLDEVLVMGSSRAWNHYVSQIIEDSLGLKTYNAGRSAQSLLYQNTILQMMSERHLPGMIILDVNENDFVEEERKYDIYKSLTPYYKSDKKFRESYDRINPSFHYFGWMNSIVYNSSVFSIIYRSVRPSVDKLKGFQPLIGSSVQAVPLVNNCDEVIRLDNQMSVALHEFIVLCRENGIELYCVFSPRATNYKCERKDYRAIREFLEKENVRVFDFVENKKFREHLEFMHDPAHLNGEGAIEFTRDMVHLIKVDQNKHL